MRSPSVLFVGEEEESLCCCSCTSKEAAARDNNKREEFPCCCCNEEDKEEEDKEEDEDENEDEGFCKDENSNTQLKDKTRVVPTINLEPPTNTVTNTNMSTNTFKKDSSTQKKQSISSFQFNFSTSKPIGSNAISTSIEDITALLANEKAGGNSLDELISESDPTPQFNNNNSSNNNNNNNDYKDTPKLSSISFLSYLNAELTRGYLLESDATLYATKRERVYTIMQIPFQVEKVRRN